MRDDSLLSFFLDFVSSSVTEMWDNGRGGERRGHLFRLEKARADYNRQVFFSSCFLLYLELLFHAYETEAPRCQRERPVKIEGFSLSTCSSENECVFVFTDRCSLYILVYNFLSNFMGLEQNLFSTLNMGFTYVQISQSLAP